MEMNLIELYRFCIFQFHSVSPKVMTTAAVTFAYELFKCKYGKGVKMGQMLKGGLTAWLLL